MTRSFARLGFVTALWLCTPALAHAAAEAVPTFHSLGLYWTPPENPGSEGCQVRFRRAGDSVWRDGLPLWYDSRSIGGRSAECRGSLVHLEPGTSYEIELGVPGEGFAEMLTASTWNEQFPIGETVHVADGNDTLEIDSGGTPGAYKLYTFAPGTTTSVLDGQDSAEYNITISAPYVIVRGLTLQGAQRDAIKLLPGAHDVVIENNDISGWGRFGHESDLTGWQIGVNSDSAVSARCSSSWRMERLIVQRNVIHHPRYGTNSWDEGHPVGPNAIFFEDCGGNHVWRYNQIYSEEGLYFMDPIGGGENFSDLGFPNADTDIYGNLIRHCWDDAIESEGANRNVRIWNNYMDETTTAVASSSTSVGPLYVFRNVYNRSRYSSTDAPDEEGRLYFGKIGSVSPWGGGRRYMFHNTLLQAPPVSGATYTMGAGSGIAGNGSDRPIENTVTRNNIWHIHKDWWASIDTDGGTNNSMDYDLYNGDMNAYSGAQAHGIQGVPVYAPGHGWSSEASGLYSLDPTSPGYDAGEPIPNFNDGYLGVAPDIGAHESGSAAMEFGPGASSGGGNGGAGGSSGASGSSGSAGSAGSAAAGGQANGGSAGASGGGAAGSAATSATPGDDATEGSCACAAPRRRSEVPFGLSVLALLAVGWLRRRRFAH